MDINQAQRFQLHQDNDRRTVVLGYCTDTSRPETASHTHDFYEIVLFQEGSLDAFAVGERRCWVKPGDIVIVPPGISHCPIFTPEFRLYNRYVLRISGDALEQMQNLDQNVAAGLEYCGNHRIYRISPSPSAQHILRSDMRAMWREEQSNSNHKNAMLYSICIHFLITLNHVVKSEPIQPEYRRSAAQDLTEHLLLYIQENLSEDVSLTSVARHFFISTSHVEALLTRQLGKPFYRYLTECRIRHAQGLICRRMPLKEVAIACGYHDYSNFYRAFVRECGQSPSDYRIQTMDDKA